MAHINRKFIDKHWLVFCFRGALGLIFGFYALSGQITDLSVTLSIISIFLLAMGIIDSSNALYNSIKKHGWFNSVIDSLIDIVAALLLLFVANDNVAFSLAIIAAYTFISGIIDLVHSFVTVEDSTDRFIRIIAGICGCIMGVIIINAGNFEFSTFLRFFGAYMLIVGVTSLIYGAHNREQLRDDKTARKEAAKKGAKTKAATTKTTTKKAPVKKKSAKKTASTLQKSK